MVSSVRYAKIGERVSSSSDKGEENNKRDKSNKRNKIEKIR